MGQKPAKQSASTSFSIFSKTQPSKSETLQPHQEIEPYDGPPVVLSIPSELLTEIVVHLTPLQIVSLSRVCKPFRDAIIKHDEGIWKKRVEAILPEKTNSHTIQEYMNECNINKSDMYAFSWKCMFFYLEHGIFRFDAADEKPEVWISQSRASVVTGKPPAIGKIPQSEFRIHLLQPGIPRNSAGMYVVHIKIDEFGTGLWLGVSRKNFMYHTWLGNEEDSWGWGNNCSEFYCNYSKTNHTVKSSLGIFQTRDIVSMKVDMKSKTLQFMKNGTGGALLDLNRIPGEDPLHFAVGLFGYNNSMAVTLLPRLPEKVLKFTP